jgi:hypothetical protein
MDKNDFIKNYKLVYEEKVLQNQTYEAITKVIRRKNKTIAYQVKTSQDIVDANNWIIDSQSEISISSWDWEKLKDSIKRGHLNLIVLEAPIVDFFPLDSDSDISEFYN